jgi:hypothetical protein
MKKLLLFILLANIGYGQYCPALGPDQLLPCGVNTTTLTADSHNVGLVVLIQIKQQTTE